MGHLFRRTRPGRLAIVGFDNREAKKLIIIAGQVKWVYITGRVTKPPERQIIKSATKESKANPPSTDSPKSGGVSGAQVKIAPDLCTPEPLISEVWRLTQSAGSQAGPMGS